MKINIAWDGPNNMLPYPPHITVFATFWIFDPHLVVTFIQFDTSGGHFGDQFKAICARWDGFVALWEKPIHASGQCHNMS